MTVHVQSRTKDLPIGFMRFCIKKSLMVVYTRSNREPRQIDGMVGSRWVRLGKANARPMLGSSKATRIKYRSTFRVVAGDEIMQMVWKLGRSRRALHVPGRSQAAVAKASVWAAGTGSGTCGLVYKYPGDIHYCVLPRQ